MQSIQNLNNNLR